MATAMALSLAIVIGSVLQRSAGLGFALVVAPIAVVLIGPVSGVMLVNLLAVASSGLALPSAWSRIDWKRYAGLAVAAVPGVCVGAWLTAVLSSGWLEFSIGAMLLLALALTAAMPNSHTTAERPALRLVAGGVAGLMSATAGAGGPAIVAYATVAQWPFRTLAATTQPYFVTVAVLAIMTKLVLQPDEWPEIALLSWAVLGGSLFLGAALAHLLAKHIPEHLARIATFTLACVGAGAAIIRGLMAMQ
jgi:uncharacterized membrane protein YfcA